MGRTETGGFFGQSAQFARATWSENTDLSPSSPRGQDTERLLGIAIDNVIAAYRGVFLNGRSTRLPKKRTILARRRPSRDGPI